MKTTTAREWVPVLRDRIEVVGCMSCGQAAALTRCEQRLRGLDLRWTCGNCGRCGAMVGDYSVSAY